MNKCSSSAGLKILRLQPSIWSPFSAYPFIIRATSLNSLSSIPQIFDFRCVTNFNLKNSNIYKKFELMEVDEDFAKELENYKKILANKKEDFATKAAAIHQIRSKLCKENPDIKTVINADIIPTIITFGRACKKEETLIEVIWILANLAFGDHSDVKTLFEKKSHVFLFDQLRLEPSEDIFFNVRFFSCPTSIAY